MLLLTLGAATAILLPAAGTVRPPAAAAVTDGTAAGTSDGTAAGGTGSAAGMAGSAPTAPGDLPVCPPARAAATGQPPTRPPGADACRAMPTLVVPGSGRASTPSSAGSAGADAAPGARPPGATAPRGRGARTGRPAEDGAGYRHLGAYSRDDYAAVGATLTVRDTGVRRGSNDFVATRLMARADVAGHTRWIEAGWTEDGWLDDDAQHVYTYDSAGGGWTYYDQYPVHDGDRISIVVESGPAASGGGTTWRAYLWWDNRWNLLAAPTLPFGPRAQLEQYVEVYVDPRRGGRYPVPAVAVSDSIVAADPDGDAVPWRGSAVPSQLSPTYSGYCVTWRRRYDSWSAGTC